MNFRRYSGTNVRKIMCNNPMVDLAKVNAYIKFGDILPIGLKILSVNEILA